MCHLNRISLKYLNLSNNNISDEAGKILGKTLGVNVGLKKLDLS